VTFVLTRIARRLGLGRTWALPALIITLVFVTSWPLMVWSEPAANDITEPGNYWWWFAVTASTVGYGDFFPTTTGGHLVGVYVIVGGIVTLTALFTRIAVVIDNAKGRRMKGQAALDMSGHLVIVGYTPDRTERLIDECTAEGRFQVALCAWGEVGENPMPERREVGFVRGDLADVEVLRRAGAERADRVLIDARDDNEALTLTVTAIHVNPDVHTVVTLRDMTAARNMSYVDSDVPFGRIQEGLGRGHTTTVIAVRAGGKVLNPGWDTKLSGDSILYYVGDRRLSADDIVGAVRRPAESG